jgi:hypothetical protein
MYEVSVCLTSSSYTGIRLPLPHAYERQEDENETFDEHSCEGQFVRDDAVAVKSNDLVCKVGVQPHAGSKSDWHVGKEAKEEGRKACDSCRCGDQGTIEIFDLSQSSSTFAFKSIPCLQERYTSFFLQKRSLISDLSQTQLPPVSASIDACVV